MMNRHWKIAAQAILLSLLLPGMALALDPTSGGSGLEEIFDHVLDITKYIGAALLTGGVIMVGAKLSTGEGQVGRLAIGVALGGGLILGSEQIIQTLFEGTQGLLL